jgi:tetratricopeptide (TPR) repeat protein
VSLGCLVAIWYFVRLDPERSIENGATLFPRDAGPPLSSKTEIEIAALEESIRQNPPNPATQARLGNAYLQKARATIDPIYLSKAEALFKKTLELNSHDFEAMAGMGSICLSRHEFRDAIGWGERGLAINPWSSELYGILGDANVELGDYGRAVELFQKMVDLRPQLSSYSRVSYMRELHGDLLGAIDAMRMAVSAGGVQRENTAWARIHLGSLYINLRDYPSAQKEFEAALTDFPDYMHAYAGLANLRIAQGRESEALELYKRVVQTIRLPSYRIVLADLYNATGEPDLAKREYAEIKEIESFNRANGKDTEPELILFAADQEDNIDDVLASAKRQFERQPNIKITDALAWCLYKARQYGAAKTTIQQALALGTKDPLMLYHAGMIHLALAEQEKAQKYLAEALSINRHFSIRHAPEAIRTVQNLVSHLAK